MSEPVIGNICQAALSIKVKPGYEDSKRLTPRMLEVKLNGVELPNTYYSLQLNLGVKDLAKVEIGLYLTAVDVDADIFTKLDMVNPPDNPKESYGADK